MAKKEARKDTSFHHAAEVEKIIGYTFSDKSLLAQAFTRTSFCNEVNSASKVKYQSSEVLEFFGDGVLSVAIISLLLRDHVTRYEGGISTRLGEGDFSNIKSKLSDKKNLSKSTHALGLERFLRMGEGDKKLGVDKEPSVMEDLFESIIGAVYIDSGMSLDAVIGVVKKILDVSVYNSATPPVQSAKNALQEWCQDKKRRLPPPVYKTLKKEGPDHKTTYEIGCFIEDKLIATGVGKNEKLAGAKAAEAALLKLMGAESKKTEEIATQPKAQNQNAEKKLQKKSPATIAKPSGAKADAKAREQNKKSVPQNKDGSAETSVCHSAKLKAYAKDKRILSPGFVDLGMQKENGRIIHRVECRLDGKIKVGKADTRERAKEEAARLVWEELSAKSANKASKRPTQKKPKQKN